MGTYLAAPVSHVVTVDCEWVIWLHLQPLLSTPSHVLDCQFSAIVIEEEIVIPGVDVDANVRCKDGGYDAVGRRLH